LSQRFELTGSRRDAERAEIGAERRQVNRPPGRARTAAGLIERRDNLRLCLEDLVPEVIAHLLAREPDQAEAVEVVQVRRHAI